MSTGYHAAPGIKSYRALGYQIDWRDRLPLSMRHGRRRPGWHVLSLGRFGYLTFGRLLAYPRGDQ